MAETPDTPAGPVQCAAGCGFFGKFFLPLAAKYIKRLDDLNCFFGYLVWYLCLFSIVQYIFAFTV